MTETCYACDRLKTSMEHVPPKYFFPKNGGLRKELITVPSCDKHNNAKSKDDEFLRTIILTDIKTNSHGKNLFFGKTLRAVQRSPFVYEDFLNPIDKQFHSDQKIIRIDIKRLDSCIEQLTKAIYFHTFKLKWAHSMLIRYPTLGKLSNSDNYYVPYDSINFVNICRSYLSTEPTLGDNPEIFKYRIKYDDAKQLLCFGAQFYDAFEVFLLSYGGGM